MSKSEKHFLCKEELAKLASEASEILADNVGCTLGPKGRNVVLRSKNQLPIITKDGATVAKFLNLKNPFQDAVVEILKQSAEKTNIEAGDGTTSSIVLSNALFQESINLIKEKKTSAIQLKRELEQASIEAIEILMEYTKSISSIEDIENIAKVSSNGDELISGIIAKAIDESGKNSAIVIEKSADSETKLEFFEGFKIPQGMASTHFATDEKKRTLNYNNPLILVTDHTMENIEDFMTVLQMVAHSNRPLMIICSDIIGSCAAAFVANARRGSMKIAVTRAPFYGEKQKTFLSDLATSCGATFYSKEQFPNPSFNHDFKMEMFGSAKNVFSNYHETVFTGCNTNYDEMNAKIAETQEAIKDATIEQAKEYQERLTWLSTSIATIMVGGFTEVEVEEKKHRVEDALEAVKSAQALGIVPGGGTTYINIANRLRNKTKNKQDYTLGKDILCKSLLLPFIKMAENCNMNPIDNLQHICTHGGGIDFYTEKYYSNFELSGIVDPCKVIKNVIQNSVSVVGTLLMVDFAIVED